MKKLLITGRSLLIFIFAFISLNIFPQATKQCVTPLQNGDKVLFIGNSFTEWNGPLPSVIQSLITASGSGLNVSFTLKVKGMGIYKEYATWSSLGMIAEIQKGGWKYVVLQGWMDAISIKDAQVSEGGVTNPDYIGYPQCQDTMLKYLQVMDAEIKKVGAITILYEPHVGKNNFYNDMIKSHSTYQKLQYNVSSFYAPIVNAWDTIKKRYPASDSGCTTYTPGSFADFMYADCGHQSVNGMMLDALTFYTIFTHRSGSTLKPITTMANPEKYEELAKLGYNTGKTILTMNGCGFTDTQAPTVPAGLNATTKMPDSFVLNWTASTDNVGVLGYYVYQDGVLIGTTAKPKLAIGGLTPATTYAMTVKAFDSEGNKSVLSSVLNVTTDNFTSVDTSGVLLSWNFAGMSGVATAAATKVMVGISSTTPSGIIGTGPVFVAGAFGSNDFSMTNQNKTTLADAITANQYITFSISPQAGNTISVTSITMRPYTQNHPLSYTLMSSVKGFTGGNEIGTITEISQSNTALQTIAVTGHDNISTTTEFRVYIYGSTDPWSSFGLGNGDGGATPDDLFITGSVKSSSLPTFPTYLSATNLTETGFTLNWKAAKNAVSYEVFRNGVSVGTTATLSKAITGVTIGTTYTMTVKATDNLGTVSEESVPLDVKIPDLTLPSVPVNLTVSGLSDNTFTLHWSVCTDNVGVVLYEINMNGITYGNTADTYLPVPLLTANTSYSMTVRSKDAAGNVSAFSAPLVVKTNKSSDMSAPTTPWGLSAPSKTSATVNITWMASTDNVGVTWYLIYKGGVKIDSTKSISYTATGLTANTAYTFAVKARDAAGNVSAASTSLNVTTAAAAIDESNLDVSVYPNPANNFVIVDAADNLVDVTVEDINGKTIIINRQVNGKIQMNIENYPAGIYFAKIVSAGGVKVCRFVKE